MLTVQNLQKKFGGFEAVRDVSFTVDKGEAFSLLGPNGAGKTTIIQMITGLYPPTSGMIKLSGIDVMENPKDAQKLIGVVPQEVALYQTMSARENLKFWGRMYGLSGNLLEKRVSDALEMIGLTDRAKHKIETFSGGMKRRVNIAAAILHQPELLIMDEPTVGIDPQSRNHILNTVKHLNSEGMTIIYTSHYMEEVEFLCKRIGVIDQGKLIACGTMPELREMIGDQSRIIVAIDKRGSVNPAELSKAFSNLFPAETIQFLDHQLMVFHKEPQSILSDFIQLLIKSKIKITSVDIVEPNLESVFLHLTGRSLRD